MKGLIVFIRFFLVFAETWHFLEVIQLGSCISFWEKVRKCFSAKSAGVNVVFRRCQIFLNVNNVENMKIITEKSLLPAVFMDNDCSKSLIYLKKEF